jgi:Nucleotidyl transferase AbiEii toxin, Type IV TA system
VFLQQSKVIQRQQDTLTVLVPVAESEVKVSFFGSIDIGRAGVPERTSDGTVEVASLLDLLATKLKVILQRVEAKDYQDIAAILRSGLGLEEGLAAAAELFAPGFQPSEAIKAITYFEGGDLDRLSSSDKYVLTRAASMIRRTPVIGRLSGSLSA